MWQCGVSVVKLLQYGSEFSGAAQLSPASILHSKQVAFLKVIFIIGDFSVREWPVLVTSVVTSVVGHWSGTKAALWATQVQVVAMLVWVVVVSSAC